MKYGDTEIPSEIKEIKFEANNDFIWIPKSTYDTFETVLKSKNIPGLRFGIKGESCTFYEGPCSDLDHSLFDDF